MLALSILSFSIASNIAVASASTLPAWLTQRDVSPDMTCGNTGAGTQGYTCPDSLCCSQYGYCGSTTDYCSTGCQPTFGTCSGGDGGGGGGGDDDDNDNRCGAEFGDRSCSAGACCSEAGWCGTSEDYCQAPACQWEYGSGCDANKVPAGTNTSTISRPSLGNVLVGGEGIYGCVNDGVAALTYDDGPSAYTSDLLDLLDRYNAKATFFVSGNVNGRGEIDNSSLEWPATLQRMYSDGHQIASHTWSHDDLSEISSARRKDEMYKNEMAIRNVLGVIPTYMRPPYSSCTAASGCQADMATLQYHIIYFDLDTADYLNTDASQIQNSKNNFDNFFVGKSADTDSALVIAHDIHQQTVYNLTEYMLQGLQSRGFSAVTVGDCLGDPAGNWYRQVSGSSVVTSSTTRSSSSSRLNTGVSPSTTTTRAATSSSQTSPRSTTTTTGRSVVRTTITTSTTRASTATNLPTTSPLGALGGLLKLVG
ncbi:glycoside hydrolase/deacetylase [Biscogniauxia marginata]|nr:glycoside hydrolase/deacetylase [Biscogniauxia marginata]